MDYGFCLCFRIYRGVDKHLEVGGLTRRGVLYEVRVLHVPAKYSLIVHYALIFFFIWETG